MRNTAENFAFADFEGALCVTRTMSQNLLKIIVLVLG